MNDVYQIYIYLEDEGTDVWRPVEAKHLVGDTYEILSKNNNPEDEHWRFNKGDIVRCEARAFLNSRPHECLVAIEKIS